MRTLAIEGGAPLRTIPLHERYSEDDIRDISRAVRSVAETYAMRSKERQ